MEDIMGTGGDAATEAWAALGEDPALLSWVMADDRPAQLPGPLPTGMLAAAGVRVVAAQAALIGRIPKESGSFDPDTLPTLMTDPDRMAVSYSSDKVFRWNNEPVNAWAPLSGFWRAADGWVRTHANYPHHRARLLSLLGLPDGAEPAEMTAALERREALELEDAAAAAGAVLFAVRDEADWRAHPQAFKIGSEPLIGIRRLSASEPRPVPGNGPMPLSGVRVLDLTRVIAGPVATRTLAYLGADVLRIDPPGIPEIPWQYLDSGQGKRSCSLDLAAASDLAVFRGLLDEADVLVTGYRPGGLDRFGLSTQELAVTHPGLLVGRISAWGAEGPWSHRRGFDSIVQAVTGISLSCRGSGSAPGALPAQALDHSAGHLLAAGIIGGIRERALHGSGREVSVNLARISQALLAAPRGGETVDPCDPAHHVVSVSGPLGEVATAAPAFTFTGGPSAYRWGARGLNQDRPEWEARAQ